MQVLRGFESLTLRQPAVWPLGLGARWTWAGGYDIILAMKIKKPMTIKTQSTESSGGAAIADRFKLDPVDTTAARSGYVSKKSAATALVFGLIALAITITLAVTIYKHWEFLMPA